jgi:carboxyl-terminal processing protease
MESNSKWKVWIPLAMAGCIVAGLIIGTFMSQHSLIGSGSNPYMNKVSALMSLIDGKYVDSVDQKKMVEDLIPKILGELDPHSVYIPADDRTAANEQIEGSFSGIGVQYHTCGFSCKRRTLCQSWIARRRPDCENQWKVVCG